ncbi:Heat shock protein 75 kda, mitochondrial precursor [Globisporangium polare]
MMRSAAQRLARAAAAKRAVSNLRVVQRNALQRDALQRDAFAHARAFKNGKLAPTIQLLSSACMSTSASDDKGVRHEFQAETRQLLDIVTHSIYTDKEVFIRELISNASDALEKLRHVQATGQSVQDPELEPKIVITTNEAENTLTIMDTGIGMSKAELIENLGTIARSGSKAFLEQLKEKAPNETGDALTGIIGKFGVGFYSAFMVADKVEVFSQSAAGTQGSVWSSDGSGSYEVAAASDVSRGSKIVIHLKESCKDYGTAARVESIIRRYSNFVSFPIVLNGETVNTVQALWTKSENEVTDEEYTEFYKFIANAFDDPAYRIIFKADAPIELKTLFFIGSSHSEKFGYARLEPGVSLYSRKVLIERNSPDILPDWLRFVRGVVDSEDLPLSLSREKMQDSRLILKIKDVLTRRIIRFLEQQSTKEPEKFETFFKEFGQFIKEGICTDFQNKGSLAKLLRYESSHLEADKLTTLDEYISRASPDQNELYYLCAPSRAIAEASPYYEAFKKTNKEVLFVYSPIDDFVMTNVGEFNGRKVVSAENAKIDIEDVEDASTKKLSEDDKRLFGAWLKLTLEDSVKEVKFTSRLSDSPAIISEFESASIRKMMAMVNDRTGQDMGGLNKHVMEINPSHRIVVDLNALRQVNNSLAQKVARQIYTNATVAAGLVDDGRTLLTGLNDILGELLEQSLPKKADE